MMGTQTLIFIFFSLCGAGILFSLTAPPSRQGNVLTWLGCLAAIALVLAGANGLLGGGTFRQPLWSLPGLATLTLSLDRLSAVFLFITGLVLFPASILPAANYSANRITRMRVRSPCCCSDYLHQLL